MTREQMITGRRIVLEHEIKTGTWTAYLYSEPYRQFHAPSHREAVNRLMQHYHQPLPLRYEIEPDLDNWSRDRAVYILSIVPQKTQTCPECRGSGRYVGLNVIETCQHCGGKGVV